MRLRLMMILASVGAVAWVCTRRPRLIPEFIRHPGEFRKRFQDAWNTAEVWAINEWDRRQRLAHPERYRGR